MNEMNWSTFSTTVTEKDRKNLEKARIRERKLIKEGWRYYKINDIIQVLVPFGEDGKPTERGQKMIEIQKKSYGIK